MFLCICWVLDLKSVELTESEEHKSEVNWQRPPCMEGGDSMNVRCEKTNAA